MIRRIVRKQSARLSVLSMVAYPLALVAAVLDVPILFVVAMAATHGAERLLKQEAPETNQLLARVGVGLSVRYALRDASLIVFVCQASAFSATQAVVVAACVAGLITGRAVFRVFGQRVRERRVLPVLTRNIDLSALKIPDAAPAFITRGGDGPMAATSAVPLVGVLVGAFTHTALPALLASVVAVCVAIGLVASGVRPARKAARMPSKAKALAEVKRKVHAYAPEVVVYFSGGRSTIYQVNMWLAVAARLDQRALILMREPGNMRLLAATSLPVICVPDSVDLMNFELPSVRVALYPSHVGNNIHFLRIPGMAHVFTCHGESDKLASVNPFSKAYDEVWVAGLAGRERYAIADVGVRDEDIVEVGGPQLASIQHASRRGSASGPAAGSLTVLYAPTWEGWTDDPQNTSVISAGPDIVARLLAHPSVARVIYKPHPLTGTRSAAAARSSKKITGMINRANRAASGPGGGTANADRDANVAELARLRALASTGATTRHTSTADDVQAARDDGALSADNAAQVADAQAQWSKIFWSSQPSTGHVVVKDSLPDLYDCFNSCDVMVTDLSGVIADFLVSEKPYVVTNSSDIGAEAFRAKYPTTAAAYLIEPDCGALDGILTDLSTGVDPLAEERHKLKVHMLGDDDPASERFQLAMDRLIAKATERMVRRGDITPAAKADSPVVEKSLA